MRPFFADSHWERLFKGTGMPLGNGQRLLDNLRAILKGTGERLGNAEIPAISQQERRQNFQTAIGKNVAISKFFSEGPRFC